jgi:hypothetical protein
MFSFKKNESTKPPFQSFKPLEPAKSYKFLICKELESVNFLKSFFCEKLEPTNYVNSEKSTTLNR